jgi:Cft2 family RNA processing exonuclease
MIMVYEGYNELVNGFFKATKMNAGHPLGKCAVQFSDYSHRIPQ